MKTTIFIATVTLMLLSMGCKKKINEVPPTPTPEPKVDLLSGTYVPAFEKIVASYVIHDGKKEEKPLTKEAVEEMWGERATYGIPATIKIEEDSLFIDKRFGLVEKMKVVKTSSDQLVQVLDKETNQAPISLTINANGDLELPVSFFHIVRPQKYRQFLAQGTSYTMHDDSELPRYETGSFYWTHIIVSFKKETAK